jgi:hypothetical protein
MNEQLSFSFDDAPVGAVSGLVLWREQREAAYRQYAHALGLPLRRHVEVILRNGLRLRGRLELAADTLWHDEKRLNRVLLRIGQAEFSGLEVDSCIALD